MKLKKNFYILNSIVGGVMIMLSLILIFTISNIRSDLKWVTHTYEVINETDRLLTDLVDQERDLRGYLTSGEQMYHESYDKNSVLLDRQLEVLVELVDDNPYQQQNARELGVLVELWHQQSSVVFNGSDYSQNDEEAAILTMNEISEKISAFVVEEERLLVERNEKLERQYSISIVAIVSGIIAIIFVTLLQGKMTRDLTDPLEDLAQKMKEFNPENIDSNLNIEDSNIYEVEELKNGYKVLIDELKVSQKEFNDLIRTDQLTGVNNRRGFDELLNNEWRRVARSKQCLSLLMIDIDYFKAFNDTYGHVEGDACLRKVSSAISDSLRRPFDSVSRFGGEEFAVILPDTDSEGAFVIAELIRKNVESMEIEHSAGFSGVLTVSIGVADSCPENMGNELLLIENSDTALYKAKKSGRNQTHVFGK